MNERKLALLKRRAEKRKKLEAQQEQIVAALEELKEKDTTVVVPEAPAPEVTVQTDVTKLQDIAEQTQATLSALGEKLDTEPSRKAIKEVQAELSVLRTVFEGIQKQVVQDIYARYDYTNSIDENGVRYIGYLNKDSDWFIQRLGSGTNGESSTFATGKRGAYKQAWRDHLKLNYVLRDKADIA